ncbi:MAG: protein kinase [Bryobacteraceae bacterium]
MQIAGGLAKAHAAGVIHRDLKPGNIMLSGDGLVKLLDFGLARRVELGPGQDTTLSVEGQILGTPAYMSPEQAQGKTVDTRSDVFSFAAVFYEMVSGRRAFQGDNHMSTLAMILHEQPKPLVELDPRIPRELERIVVRCLKKDPARRFQNVADLKVALEELKEESDSGTLAPAPSAVRTRGRNWLPLGLSAAFVVLVALGGWFWWHPKPSMTAGRPLTRLTSNGVSFTPAISPDGKMLAYLSTAAGPNPDIWVQQIGGGQAIQITHEKEGVSFSAFSPDGTQIAYQSQP